LAELIVPQESKAARARLEEGERAARITAWSLMGSVGYLFMLVGGIDLALALWPISFRDPTWEFGTAVTVLNGLPVLVLGLGLALISAICLRRLRLARCIAALFLGLALSTLTALFLLLTTAPVAISNAQDAVVLLGIRKAIAKGAALGSIYTLAFAWLAFLGWRHSSKV
jgi:hypothetical protein